MRVVPFPHCPFLPFEDIRICELSDRIILSQYMYETQKLQDGPIIIHLSNTHGKSVTGTLYTLYKHEEHNLDATIIYVPSWMFLHLEICDRLSFALVSKQFCSRIVIRPHQSSLLRISEWNTKLANSLKYYSTLTRKTSIPIIIDTQIMLITIEELNDNKYHTYYMENGREIDVEILKPVDMGQKIEPFISSQQEISYLYSKPRKLESYTGAFQGVGYNIGGTLDTTKSSRDLSHEAAIRRMRRNHEPQVETKIDDRI